MLTFLIFIAVLAVLVLSHEFGHFYVARRNGIAVEEFGFGFPPRLIGIRRVSFGGKKKLQIIWSKKQLEETLEHEHIGTIYSINLIPLGGFVKIKGENPEEKGANDQDSFMSKKPWQKMSVIVAGVVMNFLLAAVLLSVGYMFGMPTTDITLGGERSLQIIQTIEGMPAEKAGIKPGDKVLKVDDLSNPTTEQFQEYVNMHRDQEIAFTVVEEGQTKVIKVKPVPYEGTDRAGIGVALQDLAIVHYPWYQAIYQGFIDAGKYLILIFAGLGTLFKELFRGVAPEGVTGPVGVAVLTGAAAKLGFAYLIQFTALLSLNLAALNILPIPALDGGRLVFLIWSKLTRRPVKPRVEQIVHAVGFVLLMLLVVMITVQDVGTFKDTLAVWWGRLTQF